MIDSLLDTALAQMSSPWVYLLIVLVALAARSFRWHRARPW